MSLTTVAPAFVAKTRQAVSVVRRQEFDTSTEEGRSRERYRRAALTSIASVVAFGIAMLTQVVSVALAIGYLGDDRFGAWVVISSMASLLIFADLGLGNGLMNAVANAHGRADQGDAARSVSSAFFMLTGVALLIGVGFLLISQFVAWPDVFNVSSATARAEVGPAVVVFVVCFVVNLPLAVVDRTQRGYQDGHITGWWTALGNLLALAAVLVVIGLRLGLPWLVLATMATPSIARLANGYVLFGRRSPWLRPRWRRANLGTARALAKIGGLFLALQVAIAVGYSSDNIVVARTLGAAAVPELAVPAKLFIFIPTVLSFVLLPLWPAYREALSRGDVAWAKRALGRSIATTAAATGGIAVLLVLIGRPLVSAWTGGAVEPSYVLLVGLALWTVMGGIGNGLAMFLNGAGVVRPQVVIALSTALVNIALSVWLARNIGVAGVVWGTVLSYFFLTAIPYAFLVPRLVTRLDDEVTTVAA